MQHCAFDPEAHLRAGHGARHQQTLQGGPWRGLVAGFVAMHLGESLRGVYGDAAAKHLAAHGQAISEVAQAARDFAAQFQ